MWSPSPRELFNENAIGQADLFQDNQGGKISPWRDSNYFFIIVAKGGGGVGYY